MRLFRCDMCLLKAKQEVATTSIDAIEAARSYLSAFPRASAHAMEGFEKRFLPPTRM